MLQQAYRGEKIEVNKMIHVKVLERDEVLDEKIAPELPFSKMSTKDSEVAPSLPKIIMVSVWSCQKCKRLNQLDAGSNCANQNCKFDL